MAESNRQIIANNQSQTLYICSQQSETCKDCMISVFSHIVYII